MSQDASHQNHHHTHVVSPLVVVDVAPEDEAEDVEAGGGGKPAALPTLRSWVDRGRPPLSVEEITLRVTDSGDAKESSKIRQTSEASPPSLRDVLLKARLGSSLGVFGGSEKARRKLLSILARENGNEKADFELTGSSGSSASNKESEQSLQTLKFGYVHGNDALYPASTPNEEIQINIGLLHPNLKSGEIRAYTDSLLNITGLTAVRHKYVKDLDPGQRQAMAIALELVADPDVLVLDEPFANIKGEDSAKQKRYLAALIAYLAYCRRCFVIYTSAECDGTIYETANDVMILSHGPTSTVLFHAAPRADTATERNAWSENNPVEAILLSSKLANSKTPVVPLNAPRQTDPGAMRSIQSPIGSTTAATRSSTPGIRYYLWAFKELALRELRFSLRDARILRSRVTATAATSTIFALLLMYAADQSHVNYSAATHLSATLLTVTIPGIMTVSANATVINDLRPAILRETAHGLVRPVPLFLARLLPELLVNFIVANTFMLIMYWSVGYASPYMIFVGIEYLYIETCVSYANLIGIFASDASSASSLSMLAMGPQYLFIGLFVRISAMPVYLRWINYLCSAVYAIRLLAPEELDLSRCQTPITCATWKGFMDQNYIFKDDQWWNALGLCMFFLVTRLAAILLVYKMERPLYLKGRW